MKMLSGIISDLSSSVLGRVDVPIEDIVFDSRQVKPGSLFVALRGARQDGHQFIDKAIQSGARAIVCEERLTVRSGVTLVVVPDSLKALALISPRFWNDPSQKLFTVGVTGTNGKTTVTYMTESILTAAGWPTAVLGTINYRFRDRLIPAPNTTPFASELQRFMSYVVDQHGKACVMEVSSHALAFGRVDGVDFDVAVFTNLTQDHLDFHKTMEAYGEAKTDLFRRLQPETSKPYGRRGIVNADDPWAERMKAVCRVPVWTYRLQGPADLFVKNLRCDATGSRFDLHVLGQSRPVRFPLLAEYNVSNALAAAAVAASQEIPLETIVAGLECMPGVPGRMERIDVGQPFAVIIDYAHTEDALRHVLGALRRLQPRRILTVFGCGGDRDRTKRPLMGQAAAQLSEEVFVTSDNPRSEDPVRIALDVEIGLRRVRSDHYAIFLEREEAMSKAFLAARPGDIVLVAGKGHENYQIMADHTIPFDDRDVAKRLLRALPSSAS